MQTEVGAISHKKHEAEQRIKYYQIKIREYQTNIAELESKVERQKERIEAAVHAAEEVCPRIETDRSRQSIQSEADKLKRRIAQELPDQAEQDEVESQYVEAMERFTKTKQAIKNERKALKVRDSVCSTNRA